jgi:hypothetical protein
MQRHITRIGQAALVAILMAILISGTVFAGKPGGSTSGSCSVSPNPTAVGADYTLTATGLDAYALVNVLISDSNSVTSWNLQADASGTSVLVWHSYWTGTSSVTYQQNNGHRSTTVANCSFELN